MHVAITAINELIQEGLSAEERIRKIGLEKRDADNFLKEKIEELTGKVVELAGTIDKQTFKIGQNIYSYQNGVKIVKDWIDERNILTLNITNKLAQFKGVAKWDQNKDALIVFVQGKELFTIDLKTLIPAGLKLTQLAIQILSIIQPLLALI